MEQQNPGNDPRITVIVPVYNDWHLVPHLLGCLRRQTLASPEFEVLIVDNGSDHIPETIDMPDNAQILRCDTPGSYAARNRGLQYARGRILAFTDADCRPEATWIERGLEAFESPAGSRQIIAGGVRMVAENPGKPNPYELYDIALGIPQERYVSRGYGVTANLFVHRDVFELAGTFDNRRFSGGDAEFCRRAVRNGAGLTYRETALVAHPARKTWSDIVSKARRVKGGQITAGPTGRRLLWIARTCLPPVRAWHRAIRNSELGIRAKLNVGLIQGRLWLAEVDETARLLLRLKTPGR